MDTRMLTEIDESDGKDHCPRVEPKECWGCKRYNDCPYPHDRIPMQCEPLPPEDK